MWPQPTDRQRRQNELFNALVSHEMKLDDDEHRLEYAFQILGTLAYRARFSRTAAEATDSERKFETFLQAIRTHVELGDGERTAGNRRKNLERLLDELSPVKSKPAPTPAEQAPKAADVRPSKVNPFFDAFASVKPKDEPCNCFACAPSRAREAIQNQMRSSLHDANP